MIGDAFVFDGVAHPFNFTPKNAYGPPGQMFANHLYAFHATLTPDAEPKLSSEEFLKDWTPADIRQMVYDESDTDMLVAMPLPLTDPKSKTAGKDVPTGNHCWTLFLNTGNFKGPVTFFTPYFFSQVTLDEPRTAGMFLDSRPADPNRALQMETQYIPRAQAKDNKGDTYARIAPTSFPGGSNGKSMVVHGITAYGKGALWNAVETWFEGGPPASGLIDTAESLVHKFTGQGWATWRIYDYAAPKDQRARIPWDSFAYSTVLDPTTFGYRWNESLVTRKDSKDGPLVTLPEYYRLVEDGNQSRWIVVKSEDVPAETGLSKVSFSPLTSRSSEPYKTPDDSESCWKKPGPVAGPFQAYPGDGSVVTYYWYRFADQPALLNADLTDGEREILQSRVEKLHQHWKKDQTYLPEPKIGTLADIDPALIVMPPKGLEIGYVPIVTRQAAADGP